MDDQDYINLLKETIKEKKKVKSNENAPTILQEVDKDKKQKESEIKATVS